MHHLLARLPEEQELGLWLIEDEREAAAIADPLASIVQRRAGGTLLHPDAGDLIKAGVAVVGYIARNAFTAVAIRLAYRRAMRQGHPEPQPEGTDEP